MNPIQITDTLRESMIRYLLTTFDVNRDGQEPALHEALRKSFEADGALFNGPFLELTSPYVTGNTLEDLVSDGVVTPSLLKFDCFKHGKPIWPDTPLYQHQETAIRKLITDQRNVIVSSGTGSGKTECFLIPILNDLLLDPAPGVRAVIIYPLNALVNDQLDRLRNILAGTDITFGRYTGELPDTEKEALKTFENDPLPNEVICRNQIRFEGKIPQILVTNYAMLEYLLLRPADAPLFNSGKWRFIVLDEAHTHAGAQGIEVGLLIRRLRHRLNLGSTDTQCIATSATLTDDDAENAAHFAEALFGVMFSEDDVIFGQVKRDLLSVEEIKKIEPNTYLHKKFGDLIDAVRKRSLSVIDIALLMEQIGLIETSAFEYADEYANNPQAFLWHVLKSNSDIHALRDFMASHGDPVAVQMAAKEVFGDQLPSEDRNHALFHLIELGAIARYDEETPPLIPARYHLFARPPQGIWVCLNPNCSGKHYSESNGWSRLFPMRRERCDTCGNAVYPLYVCRTCGQTFIRGEQEGATIVAEADPLVGAEPQYFSWRRIVENPALADISEDEDQLSIDEINKFAQSEFSLCLNCQKSSTFCSCDSGNKAHIDLYRVDEVQSSKKGIRNIPISHMNECPRCRDKALGDTEIVTSISMYSTTPLSILTNELYRLLPESNKPEIANKPGQGRKLLSFYDSRQGAARFAAFLQDAINSQIYRHIIPEAIRQLEDEKGRMPDLDDVTDRCFQIAWNYRIFHNDPELSDELGQTRRASRAQRDRLKLRFKEHAMAEFTTRRRRRQSLESLGLVAVEYFEPEWEPDFNSLSEKLNLSEKETRSLVEYLLDGLRNQKIVELPDGVHRDSEVFGRNRFSPRLVRGQAQKYEVAWVGVTERQHRRRLIKQILHEKGLPSDVESQKLTLNQILNWLHEETDLLKGSGTEGYQLAYDRLFFTTNTNWYQCNQCHRLSPRGSGDLPCPEPLCTGTLHIAEDIEISLQNNYYRHIFTRPLIPMRVEEHTAQLDSIKGRRYQNDFKDGNINVLSCSTTFEMGIDLGDLQGIVLSNIPPTVANYKQRAGRAGRRTSGTAFILSWASDRPHDQTYFNAPAGMINGHVKVPHLAAHNQFILQRHINAILFSSFMRARKDDGYEDLYQVGPFFDAQVVDQPHYESLVEWLKSDVDEIQHLLDTFVRYLKDNQFDIEYWIKQFKNDMNLKGNEHYQEVTTYYSQETQGATAQLLKDGYSKQLTSTIEHYGKLLERLRKDYLINYLSDRGILPSYSFPLHTVELQIHPDKARGLRLQRDVRQAIREYAPGQEIVADKRIWKSVGLLFYRETPQLFHYKICDNCNHLQIGKEAGIPIKSPDGPCPICGEPVPNRKRQVIRYVEPDGFRSGSDSGMPAGQYIQREPNLMRSALIPIEPDEVNSYSDILEVGYSREGKLLYVNEGNFGLGFKICLVCGRMVRRNKTKCPGVYRGEPCPGQLQIVTLGFQEVTDTLQLSFHSTPGVTVPTRTDRPFWLSLMYALLQGASHSLQIERRDIDGVLFPKQTEDKNWQQTIVLYDDVPGGAGHVLQIREEIIPVVREALRIANCVDCAPDSSCYHCLRDYSNQYDHHILQRGPVAKFLEGLLASLSSTGLPTTPNPVVAMNYPRWLMQIVGRAQDRVLIVADDITLEIPKGENYHWLDLINDLLNRGIKVSLGLTNPYNVTPDDPEKLSAGRYLQTLIDKGLDIYLIDGDPEWRIIMDPESVATARALRPVGQSFILNDATGQNGLETITSPEIVATLEQQIFDLSSTQVNIKDLDPPENVRVLNVDSSLGKVSEEELLRDVFRQPVIQMNVNDRYLYNHFRIVERLGAYIRLANENESLQQVTVTTWDADRGSLRHASRNEQNQAIKQLRAKFPTIDIDFKRPHQVEHDRYIVLTRRNGSHARILIGKGLDFIKSDGTVDRTYIVIEDPFQL
jgi:ATP-dependent helicase YprA (DUF1998 family)